MKSNKSRIFLIIFTVFLMCGTLFAEDNPIVNLPPNLKLSTEEENQARSEIMETFSMMSGLQLKVFSYKKSDCLPYVIDYKIRQVSKRTVYGSEYTHHMVFYYTVPHYDLDSGLMAIGELCSYERDQTQTTPSASSSAKTAPSGVQTIFVLLGNQN